MLRTYIQDLKDVKDGEKVLIKGWAAHIKDLSKVKFVILRDKTGEIQAVAVKDKTPNDKFEEITKIPPESSLSIEGCE